MIRYMKYILIALVLLLTEMTPVLAFTPVITEVEKQYDVVELPDSLTETQVQLGVLNNSPIMYGVKTEASSTLQVTLRQQFIAGQDPLNLALIAIRENDRNGGVTEVARLRPGSADWERVKDKPLGMTFLKSDTLTADIGPGSYRIEVSSPSNSGRYMVTFGDDKETAGFFGTIKNAVIIQNFFGYSFLRIFTSSHVYYLLGIALVLFGIHRTWKLRKAIVYDS